MIGALMIFAAGAMPVGQYDCAFEEPTWLYMNNKGPEIRKLNFPNLSDDDWKFSLEIRGAAGAVVRAPAKDPLGVAGEHILLPTGQGSYALATYSVEGCELTDGGCATVVQFVVQEDKSMKILALPSALMLFDGEKFPEPFNAIVPGRCSSREEEK